MIDCPHWTATPREGIGLCAIGKGGGKPSHGFCRFCLSGGKAVVPPPIPPRRGPGAELKKLLSRAGLPTCGRCEMHAAQMDAWGPDKCEAMLDTIVDWLRAEANRRKLPFSAVAAALLVRAAISRARQETSARA